MALKSFDLTKAADELDLYTDRKLKSLYVEQDAFLDAVPLSVTEIDYDYWMLKKALSIASQVPGNDEIKHQHPTFMRVISLFCTWLQEQSFITGPNRIVEMPLGNGTLVNYPDAPTLLGKNPDCVLFVNGHDKSSQFIKTVVELTMQDPIDNKHIGKCIHYNEMILLVQPQRQFVISVVTNLKQAVFVQSFRPRGVDMSAGLISRPIGFEKSLEKILTLLFNESDYTGYTPLVVNIGGMRLTSFRFIGSGGTSHCYLSTTGDLIIKKFFFEEHFEQERLIYEHIRKRQQQQKWPDSHLMTWVDQDAEKLVLVFRGMGKPIQKNQYRSRKLILSMIDCLRELESLDIVHRDITRRHFMFREDSCLHVMLIDLGSAVVRSEKEIGYSGTAHLAANQVLSFIANREWYVPRFQHDWESFVKFLMIQFGYVTYSHLLALPFTCYEHVHKIEEFWIKTEEDLKKNDQDNVPSTSFVKLLQLCREPNTTLDLIQLQLEPILVTFN